MYSPTLVAQRIEELSRSPLGAVLQQLPSGRLERYPVEHCHDLARRLEALRDRKTGKAIRPFTRDEEVFVLNEQILTKLDYAYWGERYCKIIRPDEGLAPIYPLWESQKLILAALAREEEQRVADGNPDGLLFNILKARQLGACLDPNARVLTADLQWVRLDDVEAGMEVVAVDEHIPGGRGAARKMRTAVVEARRDVYEPAFEITFSNGQALIATGNHRLLYRTRTQTGTQWRTVASMKIGGYLRCATTPWEAPAHADAWFGGLLDGEGSLASAGSGAEVNVSQVAGRVYDAARAYLADRGYAYREEPDKAERPSKYGSRPVNKLCVSRMDEIFRLLGQTRPVRFHGRRWWEGKELPGKRSGFGWLQIRAIRPIGRRRMIDLQTSTKTFIVEGIISHNSTLCQSMLAHRVTTQSYTKCMIASDVPANSGSTGLFGMLELTVETLPWWLKPDGEIYHEKDHHIVFTNHSSVLVEAGKSMKGGLQEEGGQKGNIGRSKTYSAVHLSELSTWERPEQIDDGLIPAIPMTRRTLAAFESTAKGYNWWHQQWTSAEKSLGRFFNIFIPWYAEKQKYWRPAPADWVPDQDTLSYAARVEQHSPRFFQGHVYRLSREQLYWYYTMRLAAIEKDALYKFLEEYPAEPEESFQYSGISIWSPEVLDAHRTNARELKALWMVEPTSLIVETRTLQEGAAEQEQPLVVPVTRGARAPLPAKLARVTDNPFVIPPGYGFRPIALSELRAKKSLLNLFQVWEFPLRGYQYILGVDVSDGLGLDRSVIDVLRMGTMEREEEQVAQFITDSLKPRELAFVVDAIGHLYCDDEGFEALAAIETNNHGLSTQDTLQLHLGYRHFYQWEVADAFDPSARFTKKIGWFTSSRTRPMLLDHLYEATTTRDPLTGRFDLQVNSHFTLADMATFVSDGGLALAEAGANGYDDCVMGLGIGHYVAWRLMGGEREPISEQRRRWRTSEIIRQRALHEQEHGADFRNMAYTADESGRAGTDLQSVTEDEAEVIMDIRGVVFDDV